MGGEIKEGEVAVAILQGSSGAGPGEEVKAFGASGVGRGTDVLGELERVRSNLASLAEVVEGLRAKFNGHTHGGGVAAPAAGEQVSVGYMMH